MYLLGADSAENLQMYHDGLHLMDEESKDMATQSGGWGGYLLGLNEL